MTDETTDVVLETTEEPGQVSPEGDQTVETPPEPQPKYVTEQQLAETVEQINRLVQSQKDKSEDRIKKTVDEKLDKLTANLKAAGVELSPERQARMREEIAIETVNQLEREEPNAQGFRPPKIDLQLQARAARAEADVTAKVAELGFDIYEGDRELPLVNVNAPDPETWAQSVINALEAKADRLGKVSSTAVTPPVVEPQPSGKPAARIVPTGAPAGDIQQQLENELFSLKSKFDHASMKRRAEIVKELKRFD